jgi:hypothetical protein
MRRHETALPPHAAWRPVPAARAITRNGARRRDLEPASKAVGTPHQASMAYGVREVGSAFSLDDDRVVESVRGSGQAREVWNARAQ